MTNEYSFKIASTSEEKTEAQRIRHLVFMDEQKIPAELDDDGFNEDAFHALCLKGNETVATGRLVIPEPGKGVLARIAVLPAHRGAGLGQRIVGLLENVAVEQGVQEISLLPHAYLEKFYKDLGYTRIAGTSVVGEHELITMKKSF